MKDALLHTKLQRSYLAPDIVPRERLIHRLEEGRQRPLTVITAPAGYGKSTLASRWAEASDHLFGWVSLDRDDNDLRQFLIYLLAAIRQLFPKIRLRTAPLLEAERLPSPTVLARYLLNDMHRAPKPFILVLDDYHRITTPSIHAFVAALLEHPAQSLHLVLLTRKSPPLPLATMRGRGQLAEIQASDLRFLPAEIAAFLKGMPNVTVDDATAAILEDKTEGWAAGLRLAGLYLQGEKGAQKRAQELNGSATFIADYLFSEVLSRLAPERVSYLTETAILDRFCAPLCRRVHQEPSDAVPKDSAERFIRWLLENNLFIIGLDGEGYWFRYHHLFRDVLKGVLRQQRAPDQIARLHRMAGSWFAENGLLEEALSHLLAAGDAPGAAQCVADNRYALMNRSQFTRLNRLLAMLPARNVTENPLLVTARAFICVEQGNYIDAHGLTLKAETMLTGSSPESEAYATLQNEVRVLHNLMDIFTVTTDSRRFDAQKAFGDLPAHAVFIKAYELGVRACFTQMKGDSKHTVTLTDEAFSNPIWPPNLKARMYFHLCIAHYMNADLTGVTRTARESLQTIRDATFFHTRAYANYFCGVALYLQNELQGAESLLLGILDDRHTASPSYVAEAGFVLSCIYLSQGDEAAAKRVLHQTETHCRENGHAKAGAVTLAFHAEFAMRRGDLRQARQICQHVDFTVRPPLWYFYVLELTPIKCLLAEGTEESLGKAHTRLTELDARMRPIHRINVRIEVLALLAMLHHKRGEDTAAMEHLQAALNLAEPGGWIRTFVDLGPPMGALLKSLTKPPPGPPYVQRVLKACLAQHPPLPLSAPNERNKPQAFVQGPVDFLTRRETEILPLLAEGMSNKKIATALYVSEETVKTHMKNIFRKLGANSRIEALNKAREMGIFTLT